MNIPLDTVWLDIDYLYKRKTFTVNKDVFPVAEIKRIKNDYGVKIVAIVEGSIQAQPGDPIYDHAKSMELFVKYVDDTDFVGRQWPGDVNYLDFLNPNIEIFWQYHLKLLKESLLYDGLWFDMNEYSNFCSGDCRYQSYKNYLQKYFEYMPGETNLEFQALSVFAKHYGDIPEFYFHSLNGLISSYITYKVMNEYLNIHQPFLLSRSTFSGSGRFTAHWTGDTVSNWKFLQVQIPSILNFNMFGIPMVGDDVCGFLGDTTDQLCARWIQTAFLTPFFRNHNHEESDNQAFNIVGMATTIQAKGSLKLRYSLLKFLYSLFLRTRGIGTIIKPLFFEFPENVELNFENLDDFYENQFMVGRELMLAPILHESINHRWIYFPDSSQWYSYYNGDRIICNVEEIHENVCIKKITNAPAEKPLLFIRSGSIVPIQNTTYILRTGHLTNGFTLMAALHSELKEPCVNSEAKNIFFLTGQAEGYIIKFQDLMNERLVVENCIKNNCLYYMKLSSIVTKSLISITVEFSDLSHKLSPTKVDKNNFPWIEKIEIYGISLFGTPLSMSTIIRGEYVYNDETLRVVGKLRTKEKNCQSVLILVFEKRIIIEQSSQLTIKLNLHHQFIL